MHRTNKKISKVVETEVFDILKMAQIYFSEIVPVSGFVLAVDETGVYFFTSEKKDDVILVKLSNYMDQLDLTRDEVVVCRVSNSAPKITDDTFFKRIPNTNLNSVLITDVRPDCFEESIRLICGTRNVILTKADMIEIIECFRPSKLRQGSMMEFLKTRGFELDYDTVDDFDRRPILALDDVISSFGVTDAEQIYDAMCEYRELVGTPVKEEQFTKISAKSGRWDSAAESTTIIGSLLVVASCIMYVLHLPILGLIFAIMGMLQARHLALIYKTTAATALTWFSLATIIFGVLQTASLFSTNIITWLQNMLLIGR